MITSCLPVIATNLPANGLDSYLHKIQQIPMLTAEEELFYANQLHKNNDLSAAKKLITPHLRYVAKIAKSYSGYGLSLADLIQEGNIGLMKAVKRFDPEVGVRLVTFAIHWIKSEIHDFIIKNWRIVKIATTKAQRKLFFNLRKCKKALNWFTKEEVEMVAKDLNVKVSEVMQMEQRLYAAQDVSFDGPMDDEDEDITAPAYNLADDCDPAKLFLSDDSNANRHTALQNALNQLDPRAQVVMTERWLADDKATLHDLAARFNVSAERIRQLEQHSLKKLAQLMQD